jgi:hypothetical protein
MSEEPPDAPQKSVLHACVTWLSWLMVAVGLYFLSFGPLALLYERQVILPKSGADRALRIYLALGEWSFQNTALRRPIGMYLHLWIPDYYDIKGNAVMSNRPQK